MTCIPKGYFTFCYSERKTYLTHEFVCYSDALFICFRKYWMGVRGSAEGIYSDNGIRGITGTTNEEASISIDSLAFTFSDK